MYAIRREHSFEDIDSGFLQMQLPELVKKHAYDKHLPKDVVEQSTISEVRSYFSKDAIIFTLNKNGINQGIVVIQKSQWDSDHFGYGIGKYRLIRFDKKVGIKDRIALLNEACNAAMKAGIRLLFARVPMEDRLTIYSLESVGSILTDVLVTFHTAINSDLKYQPSKECIIGLAESRDETPLYEMAKKIFRIDHFHADPILDQSRCDDLYGEWTRNSIRGLVEKVLVARKDSFYLGFITCGLKRLNTQSSYGSIDLVGVDKSHAGEGIGGELVKAALEFFSNHTQSVYVGTQAQNVPAMRLYIRMGFKPVYSEVTLHQWLSSGFT